MYVGAVGSHVCGRHWAGHHARDCTRHSHTWRAVSGPLLHSKHRLFSCTLRWAARSASAVIMGRLRMPWATRCHSWSLVNQSRGKMRPSR